MQESELLLKFVNSLIFAAALLSGLVAGILFAFSSFIMKGLSRIAPNQGIAAMQSINITVINPLFMTIFLGTALFSMILLILSIFVWEGNEKFFTITGSLVYLAGTVLVTRLCNIPLNDKLAGLNASNEKSEEFWFHYLSRWTRWNHFRTAASFTASAAFILALI